MPRRDLIMAPKRRGAYLRPGPRRGRRRVEEVPTIPIPEVEQHPPLEETRELTSDEEQARPQTPTPRRGQRKAEPRAIQETVPQNPTPRGTPPAPALILEEVPAQPTTTFTRDVLQVFMRTSMENQAQLTQLMQTLVANQAQLTQLMQTLVANQAAMQGTRDMGMTVESCYFRDFQWYKPPSFDGDKVDHAAVETWLEAIETIFLYMNCPPEYQVHCGTYMLKGEAHFWWKGARKTITPVGGYISWNQFKEAYLCKYYPTVARLKCQATFLELK
ncbi:uncharacterized protein LOC111810207 isoform X2 [Cucurbita pepo subsp. pepo]|uniref:uncharacterized protein LOC111810207 isoform X2 n=1 Tax=Cucurbita pepo subsp. pepo TaxID=3664 RepID=UPI000C9D93DF|nr:uncharacterized protein LOC111810207 isoform X2 [Cucurbita pepo subsp. pepo]XP_023552603.1 uncharacterized protein LOC111810207 isoform X2 [Cucurbita pepo subsp. pepo]XP_023552604.1 uncharacterized protein LOC111810207 isoform X2 [Cucurbita pepo subsp. pepo]XP_023552606.1 uncharacterized protein LOC111810207 isoform X2 [Cucurbita pepo subsp. pepo]